MVAPVRFGGGFAGVDLVEPGYKITYTAPHSPGEQFILHTMLDAEADEQRVVLKEDGFSGGVGQVDFSMAESVNRFGARATGWRVPYFDGSLDVTVRPGSGGLPDTVRDWRRAWSHFEDGKLKVVARDGGNREARVRLLSFSDVPGDPAGATLHEETVHFVCLDGFWRGPTTRRTGAFEVAVPGDLAPSLRLWWDGETETEFRLPSGLKVSLTTKPASSPGSWLDDYIIRLPGNDSTGPAKLGPRFINLDRGMQGQVTREDGRVDSGTWSSLRGVLVGETLTPHRVYSFELGPGLELWATPRYLTPWR